jgi:hypothetical protein
MFVNLKIDKINEILVGHKLLNTNQLKGKKKSYIEKSSFQWASYLQVNGSRCEETLTLHCGTALEEAASWVDAGVSSWSVPNDTLLSSSLLEELVVIMCSRHVVYFTLYIYTNLMNICIINFDILKKHSAAPPLYYRLPKIFNPANIQNICHKPVDFILFLPTILDYSISSNFQRDYVFNPKLTRIVFN